MSRKILDVDVLRPLLCDFAGAPESPDYSPGLAFPSVNPTVITGLSDSQGYCLGQTDTGLQTIFSKAECTTKYTHQHTHHT